MTTGIFRTPSPANEPVLDYAPGSPERVKLDAVVAEQRAETVDIPCVINGERVFTGRVVEVRNPARHSEVLARVHLARPEDVERAIAGALEAKQAWAAMPWDARAAVLLKAAALLAGPWRDRVNAATMLGQGKTHHQAEIDAACEMVDFWRFNVSYAEKIYEDQPRVSPPGLWNRTDHRPLDGFVFAVAPFNFTSIAANLPSAPALMGNVALWKPSITASLSCWRMFELMEAAGMPPGVVQLVHGEGADVGDVVIAHRELGGLHFTGSTGTFQHLWAEVAKRLPEYRQYPRLVGETGGKDFVLAHPSADPQHLVVALLRGAFEYQGQKCSAASRAYMPRSLWPKVRAGLVAEVSKLRVGDPTEPGVFMGPVIDERAFQRIEGYLELAKRDGEVVVGGTADRTEGWFVSPTVVEVSDPRHRLMTEEIFGPVLAVYVYDDEDWDAVLTEVDSATPYALTGAVFAGSREVLVQATEALRYAAGNFYLNDKPTGAVVGQQPFGGGRASGTNDKAGAPANLLRWVSPRTIKECFDPPTDWRYPYLG